MRDHGLPPLNGNVGSQEERTRADDDSERFEGSRKFFRENCTNKQARAVILLGPDIEVLGRVHDVLDAEEDGRRV